ncbi:Low temperature viability protein [Auriculariales sp. MPI-PUGE-AT-0066]|nr:Low temperature viability protein [Auriculariales sp. MPI-PUGE-AT-0066]
MPPKSIFRRPGAKHYQLVHRSQRDPLAHDPDASPHVLRAFERDNVARKAGRSLSELENELAAEQPSRVRDNLGEAVLYGVDFDDSEYDYMQHLREVGVKEDGVESILIEASSAAATTKKSKPTNALTLKDDGGDGVVPAEALPSRHELARDYERDLDAGESIPVELQGLQPDMDPHLRQTIEALEDDAFVDDDLDGDDFFAALVNDGERDDDEDPGFVFTEDGLGDDEQPAEDNPEDDSFEARFRRFKQSRTAGGVVGDEDDDDDDEGSNVLTERADTVSGLPKLPVVGGKRRRKGASDASGYSLSSSSMFRNQGLTDLDERFDAVERQYEEGYSDEDDDDEDDDKRADSDSDEAPDLVASREDFDQLVDDFLGNYEIVGNKIKPSMPGDTPLEKLDSLRKGFDVQQMPSRRVARPVIKRDALQLHEEPEKDRWDCETILSTYSNLENHPRLIRARAEKPVPTIRLDPKTGLPTVLDKNTTHTKPPPPVDSDGTDSDEDEDDDRPIRETVKRARDETADAKKARKQGVKEERAARRLEKKATREAFASESRKRVKLVVSQEAGKGRKL